MPGSRRNNRPRKPLNRRGLVVAEGTKTETQYVELLAQHLRDSPAIVSVKSVGVGKDPLKVVKKCIQLKAEAEKKGKNYDWCVCLVDGDEHTTLDQAKMLAKDNKILLLVTNLKFEIWLLWHKADIRSQQSSVQLDRQMKQHDLLDDKQIPQNFPIARYDRAMKIALEIDPSASSGRVGPNPSSAFPVLIRLMLGSASV